MNTLKEKRNKIKKNSHFTKFCDKLSFICHVSAM